MTLTTTSKRPSNNNNNNTLTTDKTQRSATHPDTNLLSRLSTDRRHCEIPSSTLNQTVGTQNKESDMVNSNNNNLDDDDNNNNNNNSHPPLQSALPDQVTEPVGSNDTTTTTTTPSMTRRNDMEETTTTTTTTKDDSDIDSALLCAMRDGRERTALWKVEHALVDFMNKPHCQYLEVGGLGNSIVLGPSRQHIPHCDTTSTSSTTTYATKFQRCWLHRLADRFRIVRTNGILLEGAIRLLKTPQSRIPTVLLYDLPESDYIDRDGVGGTLDDDMMARVSDTTTTSTIITTTTTTTPPPPTTTTTTTSPDIPMGKLKIMKRKNGNNHKSVPSKQTDDTKGHLLLRKASSSISEKEKAYEQARARIFSEEQSTSDSTTHTSATTTGPQSSSSCTDNNNNNNNNNNSCHDIVTPSTATHTSSSPLRTVNANQQQSDDSPATTDNNTNFPIHNKNNTPNKAVYRNYMDEVCDPDFRRGTAIVVPPSSSYASTVSSYRSTLSTTPYYHTPTGPPQSSVPGSSYANHPNGRGYSLYSYNHHHHNTIANTGGGMGGTAYVPSYPPNPYPTSTTVGLPQSSSSSQPPPHATTNTPRQPQSSQAIPLTTMTAASTATSTTVVKSSISASAPAFYPSSHWNSTTHSSS